MIPTEALISDKSYLISQKFYKQNQSLKLKRQHETFLTLATFCRNHHQNCAIVLNLLSRQSKGNQIQVIRESMFSLD
jgi:hypothetical protein